MLMHEWIVDSFDTTEDGKLKWYAAPPLDVIDTSTTVHSLEYLYKKAQEKAKRVSSCYFHVGNSRVQRQIVGIVIRGNTWKQQKTEKDERYITIQCSMVSEGES